MHGGLRKVDPGSILWGRVGMGSKVHIGPQPSIPRDQPPTLELALGRPRLGIPSLLSSISWPPSGHAQPSTLCFHCPHPRPYGSLTPRWPPHLSPRLVVPPQKAFGESGGSCQMVEETLASGMVRVLGVLQDSSHHRGCLSPAPPSNISPGYSVKWRNFIYIRGYKLVPFYLEVQSKACTFNMQRIIILSVIWNFTRSCSPNRKISPWWHQYSCSSAWNVCVAAMLQGFWIWAWTHGKTSSHPCAPHLHNDTHDIFIENYIFYVYKYILLCIINHCPLYQWSLNFLPPGTGFVEDHFSHGLGQGMF